jgi:hypothetical protein
MGRWEEVHHEHCYLRGLSCEIYITGAKLEVVIIRNGRLTLLVKDK